MFRSISFLGVLIVGSTLGFSQEVFFSDGTSAIVNQDWPKVKLSVGKPSVAIFPNSDESHDLGEDVSVSLKISSDVKYVFSASNGRLILWKLNRENLDKIYLEEPKNIGYSKDVADSFFLPGRTLVDLHPLAPESGYLMALGLERQYSREARAIISVKDCEQSFGVNNGAQALFDFAGSAPNGISASPDGKYEAFFDSKKFVVTDKYQAPEFGQKREPVLIEKSPNVLQIGWCGQTFVVLDRASITGFELTSKKTMFCRSSREAKGIACGDKHIISFLEKDNVIRIFSLFDENFLEISVDKETEITAVSISRISATITGPEELQPSTKRFFATGDNSGQVAIWDITSGEKLWKGKMLGGGISSVDLISLENGNLFLACGTNRGHLGVFTILQQK